MGDMADDAFDRELQQSIIFDQSYREYDKCSDSELKQYIIDLLEDKEYIENKYTPMIKNIIQSEIFSVKQRRALILHLIFEFEDGE